MCASLEYSAPGPLVEALPAGARGVGAVVEEHDDVAEQVHALRRPLRRAACSARISATISAACARSRGVTKPMSAARAISRYGTAAWPRAATTGWPCGGRGVIEGPFTENQRPSKSM